MPRLTAPQRLFAWRPSVPSGVISFFNVLSRRSRSYSAPLDFDDEIVARIAT
jgi:hypothetical protein